MTSIVGVLCKDGIVIGADSSATFVHNGTFRTIEQPTEKLEVIGDKVIVAGTGHVGFGQRFIEIVGNHWRQKTFNEQPSLIAKYLCREAIEDLRGTYAPLGAYGALVAFPHKDKGLCLCEFDVQSFQPEFKTDKLWYCSMGCAQPITDPFLGFIRGVFWKDGPPSLQDGIFAVTWTLQQAIDLNPGGVGGNIRIAVIERTKGSQFGARIIEEQVLQESQQLINEAKKTLRELRDSHRITDSPDIATPPQCKETSLKSTAKITE